MISLCIIAFTACGMKTKEKTEGEAVAQKYFAAMQHGNIDAVLPLYDEMFFQKMPKKKWTHTLSRVHELLGNVESYNLLNWDVRDALGNERTGKYVSLIYDVKYKNSNGIEAFILFKPSAGSPIKIYSQNIESKGLQSFQFDIKEEETKKTGKKK